MHKGREKKFTKRRFFRKKGAKHKKNLKIKNPKPVSFPQPQPLLSKKIKIAAARFPTFFSSHSLQQPSPLLFLSLPPQTTSWSFLPITRPVPLCHFTPCLNYSPSPKHRPCLGQSSWPLPISPNLAISLPSSADHNTTLSRSLSFVSPRGAASLPETKHRSSPSQIQLPSHTPNRNHQVSSPFGPQRRPNSLQRQQQSSSDGPLPVRQHLPPPALPPLTSSHTSRTPCLLLTDSCPQQKRRRQTKKKQICSEADLKEKGEEQI